MSLWSAIASPTEGVPISHPGRLHLPLWGRQVLLLCPRTFAGVWDPPGSAATAELPGGSGTTLAHATPRSLSRGSARMPSLLLTFPPGARTPSTADSCVAQRLFPSPPCPRGSVRPALSRGAPATASRAERGRGVQGGPRVPGTGTPGWEKLPESRQLCRPSLAHPAPARGC